MVVKGRKFWHFRSIYIVEIVTCVILLAITWQYQKALFFVLLPASIASVGFVLYRMHHLQQDISHYLHSIGAHMGAEGTDQLFNFPMPAVVVSDMDEIVWYNDIFREQVAKEDLFGAHFSQITMTPLEKIRDYPGHIIRYQGGYYRIYVLSAGRAAAGFHLYFFADVSKLQDTYYEFHKSRPVVFSIVLDSYQEMVKNIRESERSQIISDINRLFERNISSTHGLVERLAQDRYVAVIEKQYFDRMVDQKFPMLDEAKNISTSERIPVTLSMGISYIGNSLEENEQNAKQALEMSLGRGGDQVAIKTAEGFEFFGGVSQGIEKRTKVKSRILASAMLELIENSDNVLIMGHRFADLDAIGSGIGLAQSCLAYTDHVHIVVDQNTCLANCLIDYYQAHDNTPLFVSPEQALEQIRRGTVLFVVDTHSPNLVESREVLNACKQVVVIDHHRRMVDCIDNALIFYHEPYTSSTSEMVTELSQYIGDRVRLADYHADALLAGIMLDTKDFVMKTGVRTFEAAAYLKKLGANTIAVKKLFSGPMEDYVSRTSLVAKAEIVGCCAVVAEENPQADIRIVAAQAADELLNISGVDASFVMYAQNGGVNINARSMGGFNVQVIMEEMGGGGHQTMAATQIKNAKLSTVKRFLLQVIDKNTKQ